MRLLMLLLGVIIDARLAVIVIVDGTIIANAELTIDVDGNKKEQ